MMTTVQPPTLRQLFVTGHTGLSEFWIGMMTAAWGVIVLLRPATLDTGQLFTVLLRHADGRTWGLLALLMGLLMLVALDRRRLRWRIVASMCVLSFWLFMCGAVLIVAPYATINVFHVSAALRSMWIAWRLLLPLPAPPPVLKGGA